jgi:hypothetical protein
VEEDPFLVREKEIERTVISRVTDLNIHFLLLVLLGAPGGAFDGILPGTLIDAICGGTATVDKPGRAGDSGSTYNAQWPATAGQQWQGGNGCEFGAGGGGGYYGGGGGGTSPVRTKKTMKSNQFQTIKLISFFLSHFLQQNQKQGIAGGGGGGSSYVYPSIVRDYVVIMGQGMHPGGLQHNPPQACGIGEWDKMEGFSGQGAKGNPMETYPGNNGAVRLLKPGFY